jgi:dCMP deaminase
VHAEQNAIINAARAGVRLLGGDIFIYGESRTSKEVLNAIPCFICKKMIINAGLKRVISSAKGEEKYKIFQIEDWIKEWQKQDIIEDKHKYGHE